MNRETMEKTALPSGKVFDEEFGEVADIEWVYRTIGSYRVEPAYLRLVTIRCQIELRRFQEEIFGKSPKLVTKGI